MELEKKRAGRWKGWEHSSKHNDGWRKEQGTGPEWRGGCQEEKEREEGGGERGTHLNTTMIGERRSKAKGVPLAGSP